jgi:hypothetical protein
LKGTTATVAARTPAPTNLDKFEIFMIKASSLDVSTLSIENTIQIRL